MVFTIKNSVKKARDNVKHLKNEKYSISIGDIWSIKKILILDFYLPSFKSICSPKFKFRRWFYADPFCGSGLIKFKDKDLKDEIFPGSALIGAFCAAENDYSGCFLSDKNNKLISALDSRLKKSTSQLKGKSFRPSVQEFDKAVETILKYKHFGIAILVFIDPDGYKPIYWNIMEKLLTEKGIDVIFTFMTYPVALNISASKKKPYLASSLNNFFGDEKWKDFRSGNRKQIGDKALNYYLKKIRRVSGKNTFVIGVYKMKKMKLYDMVLVTRSPAGGRVIQRCQEIMKKTTTETLKSEFKVLAKKQTRLSDHNGFA